MHVCRLPPNTTDRLQPMDITVNKPIKDFLWRKFDEWWYSQKVLDQLDGHDMDELDDVDIAPIDLSLATLKEVNGPWIEEAIEYIHDNPQIVVNGFRKSGIASAIDSMIFHTDDAESYSSNG